MEKQFEKKFILTIKNLSSLKSVRFCSDQFVMGGCKWRLRFCRNKFANCLIMQLEVADHESLPFGWRRHARYLLSILNNSDVKRSKRYESQKWFDAKSPTCARSSVFSMGELLAKDSGFVVNGELKIVAEVEVLQVIGELDVSEETSTIMETIDFNGFQLHSSQVEYATHFIERHPEIASEFRSKNPNLRTGYMSLLLSLIETLRQPPPELHKADLAVAYAALRSMTAAGFKLDWLEVRLDEMSAKKEKEEASETRMQEIKKELEDLEQKCSVLEGQLAKEQTEFLAAIAPISFDDVI